MDPHEVTCGISSIQLIAIADPRDTEVWQVIKQGQVEVSRKTMDRVNSHLLESGQKVSRNVDRLS